MKNLIGNYGIYLVLFFFVLFVCIDLTPLVDRTTMIVSHTQPAYNITKEKLNKEPSFGSTGIRFFKSRFGRQSFCLNGEYKQYAWEFENWTLFASNKGVYVEVDVSLTPEQAALVHNTACDFLNKLVLGSAVD